MEENTPTSRFYASTAKESMKRREELISFKDMGNGICDGTTGRVDQYKIGEQW